MAKKKWNTHQVAQYSLTIEKEVLMTQTIMVLENNFGSLDY